MSRFLVRPRHLRTRNTRSALVLCLASTALLLLIFATSARAQFNAPPPGTQVHDPSALKPPPGARVAIVEFEDMECPDCGRANPLLREAAAKYKIPLLRHDFPLPMHAWSMQAAVNARWFDTKSKVLGDEYRDQVFANQISIITLDSLRQFTDKFAQSHSVVFPFAPDPQGTLTAAVKTDYALGQRIGIEHTPTIWVVSTSSKSAPFVEVLDRSKLYQMIDQALSDTAASAPKAPPAKAPAKAAVKKVAAK